MATGSDEYWKDRWVQSKTGWHRNTVEEVLKTHISFLRGPPCVDHACTIFVSLCGKSVDMVWLEEQGFHVVGSELSELAIEQFFQENSIVYDKRSIEKFTVYSAKSKNITIYGGNIYNITPSILDCHVDGIWDSKAIVAVNPDERVKYAETLISLLRPGGRILMDTFEYDQSLRSSFPLSVSESLVRSLFNEERQCSVKLAACTKLKDMSFSTGSSLPWVNKLVFHIEKYSHAATQ